MSVVNFSGKITTCKEFLGKAMDTVQFYVVRVILWCPFNYILIPLHWHNEQIKPQILNKLFWSQKMAYYTMTFDFFYDEIISFT